MSWDDRLDRFAVLVVLTAMAISRPLLDLLGENAEFFLARRAPRGDIITVGLLLGIGLPLLIGLVALPGRKLGSVLFPIVAVVLAAVLVRLFLGLAPLPDWLASLGGIAGGIALVRALGRSPAARSGARYLLPAPLLFTILFLFFTPTASLLAGEGDLGEAGAADRAAPLVLVVFDELPAASLMDSSGDVYRDRYPNFGRLADDGVWFPNAVTVEQQTEHSVPAILTGVRPDADLAPFAGQYPHNIFTALSESHDLAVYETLTHLCPATFCNSTETATPYRERAEVLITDIAIVAGHNLLPHAISDKLPPINRGWGYFAQDVEDFDPITEFNEVFDQDPRLPLNQAVSRIGEGFDGRPPFLFVHALVPHHPWQLLPTGQRYPDALDRTPGTTKTGWNSESWLIDQGMQRHLLNVAYADHALGEILDALDDAGLYDSAMIVVVADHGIAIREDVEQQRTLTSDTVGEIAAVPILVKAPGTTGGIVDRRRALTIDIVPTIADVMGVDLSWQPEGESLLGPDPARTESSTHTPAGSVDYGVDGSEVLEVARRLAQDFPEPDLFAIRPPGAPDLAGQEVDLTALEDSGLQFQLQHPDRYKDVDPSSDVIPVWVAGRIRGEADGTEIFAVVVNGTVAGMSRAYRDGDLVFVQAMIPPGSFRPGDNDVDVALWADSRLLSVKTNS
jgi:hypothetical protein